jgi:carbon monoxide dehydrogenase subunit G
MTEFEGPKVTVAKSAKEIHDFLSDFNNFKSIMPSEVNHFESNTDSFTFGLGSMPKVSLKRAEPEHENQIALQAAGGPIDFRLLCDVFELENSKSEVQLKFKGEFNMMIRMMVEKPLKNLLEKLSEGISKL